MEVENYKDENRNLKQGRSTAMREMEELKRDMERLEGRVEQLTRLEDECHQLQEENSTLARESRLLHEQFESVVIEKENLECQAQDAIQALNEEREAKSLLETRLEEGMNSRLSPVRMSWAEEQEGTAAREGRGNARRSSSLSPPLSPSSPSSDNGVPPPSKHSTPYPSKSHMHATPHKHSTSLQSEIQDSLSLAEADREELGNLRKKLAQMEEEVGRFGREKRVLEESVTASSLRETQQLKELEEFRDEAAKERSERDKTIEELNQRMLIRDEQIEQLRSKLSTATAEKTSMEIEVDGLSNEIQRLKVVSGIEMDKLQREHSQEQTRNIELRSRVGVLEEQLARHTAAAEKLEGVVFNSQAELASMTDDIKSLQRAMVTLNSDASAGGRPSPLSANKGARLSEVAGNGSGGEHTPGLTNGGTREEGEEEMEEEPYYSLKIGQKRGSVQVHNQSHTLRAIVSLREQLKMVRAPLEQFTKNMLEKSLYHAARHHTPSSPASPTPDHLSNRKNVLDLEAAISKWKAKFLHKTEELSNLRSIMKARATTAEVATSSLRSKLEGQARAYQTELTKLKYQIKILKKERDEHLSLRTMYARRCEDYIDELTKARKAMEKRQQEYDELMVSLQKTIQRKLELATELEEYKMDQERKVLIPKLLESSRV